MNTWITIGPHGVRRLRPCPECLRLATLDCAMCNCTGMVVAAPAKPCTKAERVTDLRGYSFDSVLIDEIDP